MGALSDNTKVPVGWVFALLACGATATATALMIGMYFGSGDSQAASLEKRVERLEQIIPRIDRRLARMEGSRDINAPKEDRFPAQEE